MGGRRDEDSEGFCRFSGHVTVHRLYLSNGADAGWGMGVISPGQGGDRLVEFACIMGVSNWRMFQSVRLEADMRNLLRSLSSLSGDGCEMGLRRGSF